MKDLFSLANFNKRIIFSDHFQPEELALRSVSTSQTSSLTPISTRRISSMINFQKQNSDHFQQKFALWPISTHDDFQGTTFIHIQGRSQWRHNLLFRSKVGLLLLRQLLFGRWGPLLAGGVCVGLWVAPFSLLGVLGAIRLLDNTCLLSSHWIHQIKAWN